MKKQVISAVMALAVIAGTAGTLAAPVVPALNSLTVSAADTQLDLANLPDGKYKMEINMVKIDTENASMSSAAVSPEVVLSVENGKYYIIVEFQGITIGTTLGYLKSLSYYDTGYTYDRFGNPKGTITKAEVLTSYNGYVDMYNDTDSPYPHTLKFPVVDGYKTDEEYNAGKNVQFVPLHVYVPAMAGFEDQDVLMKLNWNTLEKKESELTGSQLSVSGDITMNNYIELSDEVLSDSGAKVVSTVNGFTSETAVSDAKNTENGYQFAVNVPAKDMTEDVTVEVKLSDGTVVDTYTVSVEEYAMNIIYGDYSDSQKSAAKALLNYGTYAQKYFAEKNKTTPKRLANENLSATDKWDDDALNAVSFDSFGYTTEGTDRNAGVRYAGSCLSLVSETAIKHYFLIPDIEGITFKVNGKETSPIKDGDNYYVPVTGISAPNLATKYEVTVSNGTNTYTLNYSAMDYCKAAQDSDKITTGLENVTKALYLFYNATK